MNHNVDLQQLVKTTFEWNNYDIYNFELQQFGTILKTCFAGNIYSIYNFDLQQLGMVEKNKQPLQGILTVSIKWLHKTTFTFIN